MSLKAIAEQELARLRAGEMEHETERETDVKHAKQPVSCFIDASSRFTPMKHDQRRKTAENALCFTVSLPKGETHETSLPSDLVVGRQRLQSMRPPRLLKPNIWPIVVADAVRLMDDGWAATGIALQPAWSRLELFGAVPDLAGDPYSDGLAVWLAGRRLLAVDEKLAVARDGDGWSYYHRREQVGAKLLWEIL